MRRKSAPKCRLSGLERATLIACRKRGYVVPTMVSGKMTNAELRAWRKLERLGLGYIESSDEIEDFAVTDAGLVVIELLIEIQQDAEGV